MNRGRYRQAPPLRSRLAAGPISFAWPAAIFLVAFAGYPFFELARMSVSRVSSANLLRDWPLVGLTNLADAVSSDAFWAALLNTVILVAFVLAVGLVGGLAAALVLLRASRVHRFAEALMVFVWALPPVVTGTLWKFLLITSGPVNALLQPVLGTDEPVRWLVDGSLPLISVGFVTSWVTVPFAALVIRAALLDIPSEVMEAAEIDGAGARQSLYYVVMPYLRPTLLVLAVLIVVYAFRSFDFIYVMTSGGPGTASTTLPYLSYVTTFAGFRFGQGAAVAVLSMLLVLVAAAAYVRATRAEIRA